MTDFVSYEIHTYRGGQWKIDSVYDDREIAMYEAQRLQSTGRASGIRVVEEKFNSTSGKIVNKTIFRAAKVDEANTEALERQKSIRSEAPAAAPRKQSDAEMKGGAPSAPKKSGPSTVVLMLTLGAIVLAGIFAIIGLRYLAGAV